MIRILPPRPDQQQGLDRAQAPEPGRILVEDMDELIAASEAHRLLPEYDVGPTWWGTQWWVVPDGELHLGYVRAEDRQQVEFTAMLLILERSAEVVADIAAERAEQERRAHSDDPGWPFERDRVRSWRRRWRRG